MSALAFESAIDTISLNGIENDGMGVQVQTGATGLGLPPVTVQRASGAGDGGRTTGRRFGTRSIDLNLALATDARQDMVDLTNRLSLMLADTFTLAFTDDSGETWRCAVDRTGGGDFAFGDDWDGSVLRFPLTIEAGDPLLYGDIRTSTVVSGQAGSGLLTGSLANIQLSSSQASGQVQIYNTGYAPTPVAWTIHGPGHNLTLVSPKGETISWGGTLGPSDTLVIDTETGSVTDQTGANRYADIGSAPRMWKLGPGSNTCQVAIDGASVATRIQAAWRPRAWLVI